MIGGIDTLIPASGSPAALDGCVRMIRRRWPDATFENAISAEKYRTYADIPAGSVRELLVYRNPGVEAAWDSDSADSPLNSMLYLIVSDDSVTAVADDPTTAEMRSIIWSLRSVLRMDILNTFAEAA